MILYLIHIDVQKNIDKDWLLWMKNEHVPEIMDLKIFQKNEIWKIKNDSKKYNSYYIKYYTESLDYYKLYEKKYAIEMKKKHSIKYKNNFNVKREILQLIHEC